MTKKELIEKIAERSGLTKADVERALKGFEEVVQQVVAKGADKITIPGFIAFEQTKRAARMGRNPRTGEAQKIPASKAVKISAGSTLKEVAKGTKKAPK